MSDFSQTILLLTVYRVVTVLIGLAFAILGYKLFCRGVYDKAGELKATWGDSHLILKQAAPGTFFALFGVAVIVAGLWRGIEIDIERAKMVPVPQQMPRQISPEILLGQRLDLGTLAIIEKAIDGKTLEESERKVLSQWLEKERVRIRAYEPPKRPQERG